MGDDDRLNRIEAKLDRVVGLAERSNAHIEDIRRRIEDIEDDLEDHMRSDTQHFGTILNRIETASPASAETQARVGFWQKATALLGALTILAGAATAYVVARQEPAGVATSP